MSKYEGPHDRLDGFDFEAYASSDVDTVLINVLNRHNQMSLEAGLNSFAVEWNIDDFQDPVIATQGFGNDVVLRVKTKDGNNTGAIHIGHFSPVKNKIVIYDDLFEGEEEEKEIVEKEAADERERTIEIFNNSDSVVPIRYDFEHPDVQTLHRDQHWILDEAGLVMDVLYNLKANSTNDRAKHDEIDEFSEAAVCLLPKGARFGGQVGPEPNIGLRIVGSYIETNGVKQRQYSKVTHVAEKDSHSDNENDFLPVSDLVCDRDVKTLVNLSHEVIIVSHSLGLNDPPLRFDRKELAVVRNPIKGGANVGS